MHWFHPIRVIARAVVLLALAGCARDAIAPPVAPSGLRTVPFVEPLQYERAPRRTAVDFQMVPLPKDKHLRPVFIGLRFVRPRGSRDPALFEREADASIAYRNALMAMRLDATVTLARITSLGHENIPLTRIRFDPETRMNVPEPAIGGRVISMFPNTGDKQDMLIAGIEPTDPDLWSREYTLARAPRLMPGTYRLEIAFTDPPVFPPGAQPDLIVSRDHPSK